MDKGKEKLLKEDTANKHSPSHFPSHELQYNHQKIMEYFGSINFILEHF